MRRRNTKKACYEVFRHCRTEKIRQMVSTDFELCLDCSKSSQEVYKVPSSPFAICERKGLDHGRWIVKKFQKVLLANILSFTGKNDKPVSAFLRETVKCSLPITERFCRQRYIFSADHIFGPSMAPTFVSTFSWETNFYCMSRGEVCSASHLQSTRSRLKLNLLTCSSFILSIWWHPISLRLRLKEKLMKRWITAIFSSFYRSFKI